MTFAQGSDYLCAVGKTMFEKLLPFIESYAAAKRALGECIGMADDLLHVHLGLLLFTSAALLMRRRMRSWWPLGIVAMFAILNEVIDYLRPDPWSLLLSAADVINTLVWPLFLFLLARRGTGFATEV
jgi:hypothetical protein